MSAFYPRYTLEVFDHTQGGWVPNASYPASDRPHHYDILQEALGRLVASAKNGSPTQAPIGYRIVTDRGAVYDTWTNGKV